MKKVQVKAPLKHNGNGDIVYRFDLKTWLMICGIFGTLVVAGAVGKDWYDAVQDTTKKVPILEERVDSLEMKQAVMYEMQKEAIRILDPEKAEERIRQIEAMNAVIEKQKKEKEQEQKGDK